MWATVEHYYQASKISATTDEGKKLIDEVSQGARGERGCWGEREGQEAAMEAEQAKQWWLRSHLVYPHMHCSLPSSQAPPTLFHTDRGDAFA